MIRTLSLSLLLVLSCSTSELQDNAVSKLVSAQELESLIKSREGLQLIDVRTDREYKAGHLSGAVLIDYYQSDFKSKLNQLNKDKPIAVYCAVGGRSRNTMKLLKQLGFKESYDLSGGIKAWIKQKLPIQK